MTADLGCRDAEAALLGAAMLAPERAAEILAGAEAEDFTDPRYADVFGVIRALITDAVAPDPVAVLGRLRTDGLARCTDDRGPGNLIHQLVEACPVPAGAETYRAIVAEHSLRRRTRQGFERIAQAAERGSLDAFRQVVAAEVSTVARLLDRCR